MTFRGAKPGGRAKSCRVNTHKLAKSRLLRQFFDPRRPRRRAGQAAIEYILLVAISTLIFGAMFFAIRKSVFRLWICEITPRVQSPTGCQSRSSCFQRSDSIEPTCTQQIQ